MQKYAPNMQIKYAQICNDMQIKYAKLCKNLQHSLCDRNMQKLEYAKICKLYACYMQKYAKYAITICICKISKNMHSPVCR